MKTFFLDNFRGFSKTYVNLLDVNFLVGENSSGKTSFLWAVRLLNDSRFVFTLNFNTPGVALGTFDDLVSVGAKDKTYFQLGILEHEEPDAAKGKSNVESTATFFGLLLNFVNDRGRPLLSECFFQEGGYWVRLLIRNKRGWLTVNESASIPEAGSEPFAEWMETARSSTARPWPVKLKTQFPFLYALGDAVAQYAKKQSGDASRAVQQRSGLSHKSPDVFETVVRMQDSWTWIAPIRTKPKRTYDTFISEFSEEGEHTPYLIRSLLSRKTNAPSFLKFLEKAGRESGLFSSLSIRKYGRDHASPFELDVDVGGGKLGINNVGYGVSQSLPIMVELFARPETSAFAIQQPEVHLHPRAQAALGELIFDVATTESKRFLIETHSDYLMDRFRVKVKGASTSTSAQIVFFERVGTSNVAHKLPIGKDGTLPESQPAGYRRFFVNEALDTLGLR